MATAGARFDDVRAERLLEAGRALVAELDTEVVLERLLETARELTGARYAAIGVLDEQRRQLERFLTAGVDPATHAAIGDLPRGRGVLGLLIDDPKPLVLPNVAAHPRSYGFPAGHPPMTTFLGVPLIIRGEAWGNVYLTEKADGDSTTPTFRRSRCSPTGPRSRSTRARGQTRPRARARARS